MDLRRKADELRLKTFETITHAGGGHYGGSLSAIEIMTVLYYDIMNIDKDRMHDDARDRFVLCKGHAGPPLYAVLADRSLWGEDLREIPGLEMRLCFDVSAIQRAGLMETLRRVDRDDE